MQMGFILILFFLVGSGVWDDPVRFVWSGFMQKVFQMKMSNYTE